MILFFDTETTGLYPGNICQLSYIMQTKDKISAKNFFFTVNNVEYGAFLVHGFSVPVLEKLSNGKRFIDFIDEIEEDFLSADVVIAHNYSFDNMFMSKEFENCGRLFSVKKEYCSMKSTVPICKLKRSNHAGYKYPKVSELCEKMGVSDTEIKTDTKRLFGNESGFHDARFDTTAIYLAMNNAMENYEEISELKDYL